MAQHALVAAVIGCVASMALTPTAQAQSNVATVQDIWMEALRMATNGNFEDANESLERVRQLSQQLGVPYYPLYARSAAGLARHAQLDGNAELQSWAEAAAIQLDPASPEVFFVLADIARHEKDWAAVMNHLLDGLRFLFLKYTTSMVARADLYISIAVALLIFAAAASLVLAIRYGRQIIHDFREALRRRLSPGVSTVIAFALLFLPVFLWLHPIWLMPYWFILTFGYASIRERALIVVLLLAVAAIPVAAAWSAYRIAGLKTAVIQASQLVHRSAYDPYVGVKLSELLQVMPEEPRIHLLIGNLFLLEGDDNQALVHYQRAAELDNSFAGAHLNIGNIHFLNGDFPAATVQYERAGQLERDMVAAYFNASVVAGESFNFERQAEQLELAKAAGRSEANALLKTPPPKKVVVYRTPYRDAWEVVNKTSESHETRQLFGNYATFQLPQQALHPLALGGIVALIAALLLWLKRRSSGYAGSCVKCGRTFCHRCKSSRESATYCTQCIHIYIKRDGVLSEAKQRKLSEVQQYQKGRLRHRKLLSTVLPGAGYLLDGATWRGAVYLLSFVIFGCVAVFTGHLAPIASPAETMQLALRSLAILGAALIWILAVIPVYRSKVTAA